MQNNQQNKGKCIYQHWWKHNGNQMAMQQTQKWKHPVQHDSASTGSNKPPGPIPMNLGKFQGKCYQCRKPGYRVQDCRLKLNVGQDAA